MDLTQSTVLVTGAARGIGRHLLEALVRRNARRVYAGVRNPFLTTVPPAAAGRVSLIPLDITAPESIRRAAEQTGDVTLLINNAGSMSPDRVCEADPRAIRRDMETNYFGTLEMARTFAPILMRNQPAAIVNVLSISALAAAPGAAGYSASKAASHSLTQSLRCDLSSRGIAVHGVYPGPADTAMTQGLDIPKADPCEIAEAILDGLEQGQEDIFPDGMSRQGAAIWSSGPKTLEKQLAMV